MMANTLLLVGWLPEGIRPLAPVIAQFLNERCTLCAEGTGLLTRTGDGTFDIWCLGCVTSMLDDMTPEVFMHRGDHSYTACTTTPPDLDEVEE